MQSGSSPAARSARPPRLHPPLTTRPPGGLYEQLRLELRRRHINRGPFAVRSPLD
jgi:hypothetical protein